MSVLMLAGRGEPTWYLLNALRRRFAIPTVVLEDPPGKLALLRGRARRLGWGPALGQAAFLAMVPLLRAESRRRAAEIVAANGLSATRPHDVEVVEVATINGPQTVQLLQQRRPRVVIVSGTRILSRQVLGAIAAPFINLHAGVTPRYRGVHGGYWALHNGDAEHAGVSVHLVDPGVDSGPVLYQVRIDPTPADNFCTYPLLQMAAGIPLLARAIEDALEGRLAPIDGVPPSRLYHHPTVGQYLTARVRRGIK
jgi:phosphoribosylglycinamide formyltransferase 1